MIVDLFDLFGVETLHATSLLHQFKYFFKMSPE
jgi:hypothetical protein